MAIKLCSSKVGNVPGLIFLTSTLCSLYFLLNSFSLTLSYSILDLPCISVFPSWIIIPFAYSNVSSHTRAFNSLLMIILCPSYTSRIRSSIFYTRSILLDSNFAVWLFNKLRYTPKVYLSLISLLLSWAQLLIWNGKSLVGSGFTSRATFNN